MTKHHIKMAKSSSEESEALSGFLQQIEDRSVGIDTDSLEQCQEFIDWLRENLPNGWRRVAFGYSVLVENFCDPNKDYLEWKPELAAIIDKAEQADQP